MSRQFSDTESTGQMARPACCPSRTKPLLLLAVVFCSTSFGIFVLRLRPTIDAVVCRPASSISWRSDGQLLTVLTPQPAPVVPHENPEDDGNVCRPGKSHDSQTGAFCIDRENPHKYPLFTSLCSAMEKLLAGKEIVDFGTGYGYFGRCMLRMDKTILPPPWDEKIDKIDFLEKMNKDKMWDTPKVIKSWTGYDAVSNIENFTSGFIQYFDLTKPRFLGRMFDWVTCLEVAEHIPVQFERIFIENLIRHAREGIVISWALPCKKCPWTIGHVNEQPNWYAAQRMAPYGFAWDEEMRRTLTEGAAFRKEATLVFRRIDPIS